MANAHPGFVGEDEVCDRRESGAGSRVREFHERIGAGEPLRHPGFLKLG